MKKMLYLVFAILLLPARQSAQEIWLHSITTLRQLNGDIGYTLDGIRMNTTARAKLENLEYFGDEGVYPKFVIITDAYGTAGSLEEITSPGTETDLFFFGAFNTLEPSLVPFSDAELDSLRAWSLRGGKLIIGAVGPLPAFGYDPSVLNEKWGFQVYPGEAETVLFLPTDEGLNCAIFNGPFGSVPMALQGGYLQGYFTSLPEQVSVLAVDTANHPTIVLDCATLDLLVSDVDAFTDLSGLSSGPDLQNDNDLLWVNTIVFMDQLPGPPVVAQDGIILSAGHYSSYQWLLDGQPIAGATDSALVITEDGNYSVAVSISGCPATSPEVFASASGVEEGLPGVAISALPNPAADFLTVKVIAMQPADFQLFVHDARGRLVEKRVFENSHTWNALLDVRQFPSGTYTLTLRTDKGGVIKQFVKQ